MPHPTIQQGSNDKAAVELAQTRLNQRKVVAPPLKVDGDFGPKTLAAVQAYQTARKAPLPLALSPDFNLIVDGVVGLRTWFRLDPELVKRHSHNLYVKFLQELLNLKGAAPKLAVDSDFGPLTEAAVKKFQQNHQDFEGHPLAVDGVVGIRTWAALNS
jgi:peptidoglycan hydrolase-like protein with peptidoglycan-binding domain